MAINTSPGTYLPDNLRVGPTYRGNFPNGLVANANGVITSGGHLAYGPGMLQSPIFTWTFTPAEPAAGFTVFNNLVALTTAGTITQAQYLPLRFDNQVSFFNGASPIPNGSNIQLDWPRVPTVTVSGADATNGTVVTIFGNDWYGYPVQMNTVIHTIGHYPAITLGGGTSGNLSFIPKAMYQVTGAYIDTPLPAGSSISIGASEVFGLPYVIKGPQMQDVISIGWNGASELTSFVAASRLTTLGVFQPSDPTFPATAITGDVRGLYGPSTAADGVKKLVFTYYVQGADAWQNQVANRQQNYLIANPSADVPQGVVVLPLNSTDLYGVPQFYTGKPS